MEADSPQAKEMLAAMSTLTEALHALACVSWRGRGTRGSNAIMARTSVHMCPLARARVAIMRVAPPTDVTGTSHPTVRRNAGGGSGRSTSSGEKGAEQSETQTVATQHSAPRVQLLPS